MAPPLASTDVPPLEFIGMITAPFAKVMFVIERRTPAATVKILVELWPSSVTAFAEPSITVSFVTVIGAVIGITPADENRMVPPAAIAKRKLDSVGATWANELKEQTAPMNEKSAFFMVIISFVAELGPVST